MTKSGLQMTFCFNKKIYFFMVERLFENFRFYLNKKIFHYYFVINQKYNI